MLQKVVEELERARNTNRELKEERRKLELDLRSTRKQFEAQELVRVMLRQGCSALVDLCVKLMLWVEPPD